MAKKRRTVVEPGLAPRLTRRQVARFEQERRRRNILFGVIGGAAVLIIGLLAYGYLREQVWLPGETVLTVNNVNLSRETYWKVRRLDIGRQIQQLQFQGQLGGQNAQFIQQRLEALQRELRQYRSSPLDVPTLEKMANQELVRQRANTLGVTISEADLQAATERDFAPPPATSTPVTTAEASQTAAAATAAVTLTPRPSPSPAAAAVTGTPAATSTPTTGPTATSTAFITPTVTTTPTAMDPAARATAGATFRDQIGALRQIYGISAEDFRELIIRPRLLEERVKAKLAEQAPAVQTQVRAAHILVPDEEQAKQVKAELAAGADFVAVARQRSTDPSNKDKGGDLDWFPRGIMAPEFEQAAFSQPVNVVGEPVKTQFGWHIIKVLEKSDTRPVNPTLIDQVRETAYDKWLKEQRESSTVTGALPLPSFAPTTTPEPAATGTPRG